MSEKRMDEILLIALGDAFTFFLFFLSLRYVYGKFGFEAASLVGFVLFVVKAALWKDRLKYAYCEGEAHGRNQQS